MHNKKKQKGYVLAIVILLTFFLTVTVASTFTIVMRYMMYAKRNLNELQTTTYYEVIEEDWLNA